jgi:hypothetical protein
VPLADCRPYPHVPELEPQAFGAGRREVPAGPMVERDGRTVAPAEPLVGQAAAKGVVAV